MAGAASATDTGCLFLPKVTNYLNIGAVSRIFNNENLATVDLLSQNPLNLEDLKSCL